MWFIMTVKFYVNWFDREIINEKEYEERVIETQKEYLEDDHYFAEWLEETYRPSEVWEFDKAKKEAVRIEFSKRCRRDAEKDVQSDWDEEEIDV